MKTADFDYDLPPKLIAQQPLDTRSASRLLVCGAGAELRDGVFQDIEEWLHPGDLLVFNDTRVIPARLHGTKKGHRRQGGSADRASH